MSSIATKLPMVCVNHILSYTSVLRKKACLIGGEIYHLDYYNGMFLLDSSKFDFSGELQEDRFYNVPNYYGLVVIDQTAYIITNVNGVLTFRNFITGKLLYRYSMDLEDINFPASCYLDQIFFVRKNYIYRWIARKNILEIEDRFRCETDFIMCVDENGSFLDNGDIDFVENWFDGLASFIKFNKKLVYRIKNVSYKYDRNSNIVETITRPEQYFTVDCENLTCTEISQKMYLEF